jgi:hypothetical protein
MSQNDSSKGVPLEGGKDRASCVGVNNSHSQTSCGKTFIRSTD